ncbi:MAG TPA: group III truncated hemoglobin [Caulobacteraceae bacterium]|nr:group III truncated hemoglobin [Caulobacteraceae bacterium]
MSMSDQVQSARLVISPGYPLGVTEAMIETLVRAFYVKVRADETIGPIFTARIADDDWEPHLKTMFDFWSSVTLMTGRYHGTPMVAHARIAEIGPEHFARWLELFAETAAEVCPPEAAALFVDRSQRIAQSLQMGIAVTRGELPPLDGPAG